MHFCLLEMLYLNFFQSLPSLVRAFISMSPEYFYVLCIYLFILVLFFVFIVFVPHLPSAYQGRNFPHQTRQSGTSHRRKFLLKLRTNFCPQLLLLLNQMSTRRELRDIDPGTPEAIIRSKSKFCIRETVIMWY